MAKPKLKQRVCVDCEEAWVMVLSVVELFFPNKTPVLKVIPGLMEDFPQKAAAEKAGVV